MAEGTQVLFNNYKRLLFSGTLDHDAAGAIKCMLVSGYTPDIDTHVAYADVSAFEYGAGLGYTVGGIVVTGGAFSQDNAIDKGVFNCDDPVFSSLGPLSPNTPSHGIFYFEALDVLIGHVELGVTPTNGLDYTFGVNVGGLINI